MSSAGRIIVYTAIFGGKDTYVEPPEGDYETVLFTDNCCGSSTVKRAEVIIAKGNKNPVLATKKFKLHPFVFLGATDYSVWVDGSVVIRGANIRGMIEENLKDADIAVFSHPIRNCIYDEAQACVDLLKDNPDTIRRQVAKYRSEGYPAKNGLVETGVLVRRHSPKAAEFCCHWWQEITGFSVRDQISFPYVAWKYGIRYNVIPGTMESRGFFVRKHER